MRETQPTDKPGNNQLMNRKQPTDKRRFRAQPADKRKLQVQPTKRNSKQAFSRKREQPTDELGKPN